MRESGRGARGQNRRTGRIKERWQQLRTDKKIVSSLFVTLATAKQYVDLFPPYHGATCCGKVWLWASKRHTSLSAMTWSETAAAIHGCGARGGTTAYLLRAILHLEGDPLHGVAAVCALGDDLQLVVPPGSADVHVDLEPVGKTRGKRRVTNEWKSCGVCPTLSTR